MSPFTPLTRCDGPDVERTSAPGNDPAVSEWRTALGQTQTDLAASQADLTRMQEQRDKALRLLEYALHLRRHGENAPGGNETWAQFDRDAEAFLRRLNEKES